MYRGMIRSSRYARVVQLFYFQRNKMYPFGCPRQLCSWVYTRLVIRPSNSRMLE